MSKLSDLNPPYRSDEEVYFMWWLEEVKAAGYIEEYTYEDTVFQLFDGMSATYDKPLITRLKEEKFSILTKRIYTPDFKIVWARKAEGIFYNELDCRLAKDKRCYFVAQGGISYVEVKPIYETNNAVRIVKVLIDWVWQKHKKFVQIVIPVPKASKQGKVSPVNALYFQTFIPQRYLSTDTGKQPRKINFEFKSLKQYAA